VAAKKSSSKKKPADRVNPFGPSALVARGLDPSMVAQAVAALPQPEAPRFPAWKKGQSHAGASSIPTFDLKTGEVRALQGGGVDYVADRGDLPPLDETKIPGAELFDVDMVGGVRIVKPTEPVSHATLGVAVSRLISWTGDVPDPRNATDVQAVWNLLPGRRPVATPGGEAR
jgi:hypothetical protein